ncbi:MAG: DUF1552 domain-containing protein [Myxococcota bacterium]
MNRFRLSRRCLLRGLGGVGVGLPALECMLGPHGEALAAGTPLPLRYLLCFAGHSLRTDRGPAVRFVPEATGPGYDVPTALGPIEALGLRDEVTVVSNLHIPSSPEEATPPPQGYAEFHWHGPPLLAGVSTVAPFDATMTARTSDQIVMETLAGSTVFPSLNYRTQALFYNLGGGIDVPDNRDTLSFAQQGNRIVPVVPTVSPRLAWQTLFTGFVGEGDDQAALAELQKRASVLDLVDWRMSSVRDKLSSFDRARLDAHWDHVRTLEKRLQALAPDPSEGCERLIDPGQDPALGGSFDGPEGNAVNLGYSDEEARAEVFADLITMALVCDRTRVVTWMITMWQSFMNARPITGHGFNCHDMHHNGETHQLEDVVAWHVGIFGGLVDRLRRAPEGSGSVLDRCAVMLLNEGGTADALEGSHNSEGMAFLMAGGAGGLVRGEHVVAPNGTHAAQVPVTAMRAVGVSQDRLGDVRGEVAGLRR